MINVKGAFIELHTNHTSYMLNTGRDGLVETLHYGGRITLPDATPLLSKQNSGWGGDIRRRDGAVALSGLRLELSPQMRGDYRRGALLCQMPHGGQAGDFLFRTARVIDTPAPRGGMPGARHPDEILCLSFSETSGLEVELFYSVFADCDVITKRIRVTNRGDGPMCLLRCLSNQLDLPGGNYVLHTLNGAWAREMTLTPRPLARGTLSFGNATGASGNRTNPFFFLAVPHTTETAGEAYGFNLVYSGSHEGSVEVDEFGQIRVLHGIYSDGFSWTLAPGESFIAPEAVMTFSGEGLGAMSRNLHRFVRTQILPPHWAHAPHPVLVNNWEGTYFNFTESKIIAMAKAAAKAGAELFVLDDGWFGKRNNDKAGLGDYDVNHKKLPGGISGLADRITRLGLAFGLWFEPEMVNEDSTLYRTHPDWAIATPGIAPAIGRNQLVLDLCRPEVRDYIVENVGRILDSANISYVKWDMNRHISDNYSLALTEQGGFMHRYILGLYEIFDALCATHPHILFEGCASGGNRFDLGILYYMPQIWLSDDTDAHERQRIQTGASYGYPQCTLGCHVSAVPNHQTLRVTPLDTRFNTAVFGALGYELDMTQLTSAQRKAIAEQIAFYKEHRRLFQYGDFYRLLTPTPGGGCRWMVVAPSQTEAMVGDYLGLLKPNTPEGPMRLAGLDPNRLYAIFTRPQKIELTSFGGLINHVLPVHLNPDGVLVKTASHLYQLDTEQEHYQAYGDTLCRAGLVRLQMFSGAAYSSDLRFMSDFASRLYHLQALEVSTE